MQSNISKPHSSPHRIAGVDMDGPAIRRVTQHHNHMLDRNRARYLLSISIVDHQNFQWANVQLHLLALWAIIHFSNGFLSRFRCQCGMGCVPQGSILGPLLFILYMNDFNYISNLLKSVMFADDTNLFLTGKDCREIESLFNRELQCISEWFTSNCLSLNVSKTLYLVFSNKNNIQLKLSMGSSLLAKQMDTKFLGVYLSANLSWNKHIDMVVNKISKNVGIIAKVRHLLPVSHTCTLYKALVEPYLSYCNLIWARDSSTVRLDRILKIQKKYVRIITFSDFRAHSKPLFKKLSILTVYDLYKYQLAIFMFKNFNGLIPATHRFMFKLNSDLHSYKTRNSLKYHVSYCRTSCRQNVAQNLGPRLWNELLTPRYSYYAVS